MTKTMISMITIVKVKKMDLAAIMSTSMKREEAYKATSLCTVRRRLTIGDKHIRSI